MSPTLSLRVFLRGSHRRIHNRGGDRESTMWLVLRCEFSWFFVSYLSYGVGFCAGTI